MGEVISIKSDWVPLFTCAECECQAWNIVLDTYAFEFENIVAFVCLECGFRIEIKLVREQSA